MNKFRKIAAFLMVLVMLNFSLHASIFGEENATLSAILTEEVIQVFYLAETITQLKAILDAGNQTIDLARESYRQFQKIKNYTWQDLLSDAKAGFCKGLDSTTDTNCSDWESSLNEMKDNYDMIKGGEGQQWVGYRSQWNDETRSFLKQMYHGSAKAYVYPKIAPNVSKFYGWDKHENDAEYVINQALLKSGLYKSVIETQKEGYVVQSAIGDFMREAEESKNLVAQGQATQMMQDQQRNKVLVEQNNRDKARYIHEENTKTQIRQERKVFIDGYREGSKKSTSGKVWNTTVAEPPRED